MRRPRSFVALIVVAVGIGGVLASSPRRRLLKPEPIRRAGRSSAPRAQMLRWAPVSADSHKRIVAGYGNLPLSFEANRGQTDLQVKFLSRGRGYGLFLTGTETVLALSRANNVPAQDELSAGSVREEGALNPRATDPISAVLRMKLAGANPAAYVVGIDELPGRSNYFIGNDPKKWHTNVPHYARVKYARVYPGIDLIHYGNQQQLEYDFVVAPGANPETIRLSFEGAKAMEIDAQGDLVLHTAAGEIREHKPVVYQEIAGVRQTISASYALRNEDEVGFAIAQYDRSQPLVIDPVLSYSTYLGGGGSDWGSGIAVDSAGNAYVTGSTSSADFPTTAGALQKNSGGGSDAFVVKLNPAGSQVVYATYLGGSDSDKAAAIAVDSAGNTYVTGSTSSTDFPTTPGEVQTSPGGSMNAFVAKLNSVGSQLVYSTYLGGSDADSGKGIAVDAAGNAYVVGQTRSANFPTANPIQAALGGGSDAFVAKLNPLGTGLIYSTYLGGKNDDEGSAIAVDSSGNAYVTGSTQSSNFPTANPLQTFIGNGTCVTGFGFTRASNFPTTAALLASIWGGTWFLHFYTGPPGPPPPCADAFVSKVNPSGSALVFSTYLGGSSDDRGSAIAVDSSGSVYVTGRTSSPHFPTANAIQVVLGGFTNAFVARLNATGSALMFSTYLGGNGSDEGTGITVDSSGSAYVTGNTSSTNFPTVFPVQILSSGSHSFATKLNPAGTALVYSGYLGGTDVDHSFAIAVDSGGNAYVTGMTRSTNFPTVNPRQAFLSGFSNAFIAKIAPIPGPAVATLPASLSFPQQPLNTTSSPQTVTLANKGDGALTVTAIAIAGANSGDYAQVNACRPFPKTLNPNDTCSIDVTFTPSTTGLRNASVTISDNAAGSPHTVQLSGNFPDFAISASSNSAIVSAGGSATSTITVTAINDFTGMVGLACRVLPAGANCNLSPSSVTVGANPGISTLTVTTTARSAFLAPPVELLRVKPLYAIWLALLGMAFVAVREPKSAKKRISLSLVLLLILLAVQQGCGGKSEQGTQSGTYNITVTGGFSSLQHSTGFTLTVR